MLSICFCKPLAIAASFLRHRNLLLLKDVTLLNRLITGRRGFLIPDTTKEQQCEQRKCHKRRPDAAASAGSGMTEAALGHEYQQSHATENHEQNGRESQLPSRVYFTWRELCLWESVGCHLSTGLSVRHARHTRLAT